MSNTLQELVHALRRWRGRPAHTISIVLTLALGVGVTTAIFSVVDGVLLRPLPWHEPDRLAVPWVVRPEWRLNPVLASSAERGVLSWPNFRELQGDNKTLESVAIWTRSQPLMDVGGSPAQVTAMR